MAVSFPVILPAFFPENAVAERPGFCYFLE